MPLTRNTSAQLLLCLSLSLLRSINDIQTSKELQLTKTQKLGLVYYEHLSVPVTREETEMITGYVQRLVDVCASGTSVEAVGGYRR